MTIGSRSRYCVVMPIVGRRIVVRRNSCVSSVTVEEGEGERERNVVACCWKARLSLEFEGARRRHIYGLAIT